jgi:hypothetical protein
MRRFPMLWLTCLLCCLWVISPAADVAGKTAKKAAPQPAQAATPAPAQASAPTSDGTPVIQIPEATFDFGEAMEGTEVEHTFTVKNTGKAPLQIEQVRPG